MHPARAFSSTDEAAMFTFVNATGFARLFLTTPDGPRVAHAPAIVVGPAIRFHLAMARSGADTMASAMRAARPAPAA